MNAKTAIRDQGTFCISCHTAVPYALARPSLRARLNESGPSDAENRLLSNITKRVQQWNHVKPFYSDDKGDDVNPGEPRAGDVKGQESRGTEAVLNALVLVSRGKQATALTADAKRALEILWSQQRQDGDSAGSWPWLNFQNQPWEASNSEYYGAALAAVAVASAPNEYVHESNNHQNLDLLKRYLKNHAAAQPLANRAVVLWAASSWTNLLPHDQATAIAGELLAAQREDGGWSTADVLGNWQRRDGTPLDQSSDGYATGLALLSLQKSGLAVSKSAIARGGDWLVANQDGTGRWPASSPNKHREIESLAGLFMSDAATAYAVLALTAAPGKQ
jgi:squalene-hopene/tetraprenyl-beta-curcumene cyclase